MLRFTIQLKSRIALQIIDNMYKIFIFWYGCSCGSNTGTSCPTVAAMADTPYLLKNLCASNKSNVDCLPGLVSEKAPGMEKCPSTSCWSDCRSEPHQDLWAAPAGHVGTQSSLLGITACEQQPLEVKGKKQRGQEEQWEKREIPVKSQALYFFKEN